MAYLDKPEKKSNGAVAVVCIIVGIVMILTSLNDYVNAYATSKWPTIGGTIVNSGIRISKDKGTAYCPMISWTYHIQGAIYTSSNDPFCSSLAQAQAKVNQFPAGARVTISYSPRDPSISTIEPGKLKFPVYFLLMGVIQIIIAIFII